MFICHSSLVEVTCSFWALLSCSRALVHHLQVVFEQRVVFELRAASSASKRSLSSEQQAVFGQRAASGPRSASSDSRPVAAGRSRFEMPCCNCQANRRCVRCSCVKRKTPCVDCYPGRNRPSLCHNGSDQEMSSASSQPAAARLDSHVARQPATDPTASSQPTVRHVTRTRPPVD